MGRSQDFRAEALPPLRPAAFFWAVVPPWLALLRLDPEWDFLPPRLEAPGEFAIFAARSFDMPLSFSASYCFSFLTLARLLGIALLWSLFVRLLSLLGANKTALKHATL